jgi:cyclopropane fatty-acyl-phospholipid synthase-like methyltransferase
MEINKYKRFENLTFEDFRRLAHDESLSKYEKIGFPDSYRHGKEELIFEDIVAKLPLLDSQGKTILDIGPGCSELPSMIIDLCRRNSHTLILVDSEEMLAHLPDETFIKKVAGYYPRCEELIAEQRGRIDVCLAYSILHYIFAEANVWEFLDRSLELLSEGGEMLIGDIPNVSKRKRFFSSEHGIRFHREFTGANDPPEINYNQIEHSKIDDSVVLALLMRARSQGFDAYLIPQREDLPMANRREDILIKRP